MTRLLLLLLLAGCPDRTGQVCAERVIQRGMICNRIGQATICTPTTSSACVCWKRVSAEASDAGCVE